MPFSVASQCSIVYIRDALKVYCHFWALSSSWYGVTSIIRSLKGKDGIESQTSRLLASTICLTASEEVIFESLPGLVRPAFHQQSIGVLGPLPWCGAMRQWLDYRPSRGRFSLHRSWSLSWISVSWPWPCVGRTSCCSSQGLMWQRRVRGCVSSRLRSTAGGNYVILKTKRIFSVAAPSMELFTTQCPQLSKFCPFLPRVAMHVVQSAVLLS